MNLVEVAIGGPILRTFSIHPFLYLHQQVTFSNGRSIPVKLLSETGPKPCRNSRRRIVARLCDHNPKVHSGVSIDCGIKGQMVAKNDSPSLCNLERWPLWNQNFGGVALERGVRMRCRAQQDQKRGSSKSQGQQGEARRKDAQESKSSDTGVQGGGGFAGLASLKARLEDATTPIRNADDEERKAEFMARASLKRIPPPTNSSNPKTNQLVGTCMVPTTGQQSTSQNPSQEKGLKARPNPRTAPKVSNKGTHVQSNVSSPESDRKGPSQRPAWKVQNKVKKPPQELQGAKTEATPVGNTSNSFEAWKKNSSSEYDSGSESDDGQGTSKGAAILAAMQRAAAADRAKSTRRRRDGGGNVTKVENQGGSELVEEMPLKPIVLKQEWIDQIQSLEKLLNDLKHI